MHSFTSFAAKDPDRATVESAFTQLHEALADENADPDRRPGNKWLKRFRYHSYCDGSDLRTEYSLKIWYPDVNTYTMEGLPAVLVTEVEQLKLLLQGPTRKDPRVMASAWYWGVLPYGRVLQHCLLYTSPSPRD